MNWGTLGARAWDSVRAPLFQLSHLGQERFECPICRYRGPFQDSRRAAGTRRHAQCPGCKAFERHRLQFLVLNGIFDRGAVSDLRVLHFAPEPFFRNYFSARFPRYETADLQMEGVDHRVDLQALPFDDASYDFVFASHVLEHVPDDESAIAEIRRVLRPGGIAVLPVPLVAQRTIEYPQANPNEDYHVRAPGPDYFERYARHFSRVEQIGSEMVPEIHQTYIYEDRSGWPTPELPWRQAMPGERHRDIVPVCHA